MHHDTWKGIILQKQGLLKPQSVQQICQNLNGLQAQFQPYVHIGFRNRMTNEAFQNQDWQASLTRQWSLDGQFMPTSNRKFLSIFMKENGKR